MCNEDDSSTVRRANCQSIIAKYVGTRTWNKINSSPELRMYRRGQCNRCVWRGLYIKLSRYMILRYSTVVGLYLGLSVPIGAGYGTFSLVDALLLDLLVR